MSDGDGVSETILRVIVRVRLNIHLLLLLLLLLQLLHWQGSGQDSVVPPRNLCRLLHLQYIPIDSIAGHFVNHAVSRTTRCKNAG
jgi:hypothetical protein